MESPAARPTCEHGKSVLDCRECGLLDAQIREIVKPLVDEFWENKGQRDLNHLMRRAYNMGRKHKSV